MAPSRVHIVNKDNLDITLCKRDSRTVRDYVHPEMHPKTMWFFIWLGEVCRTCLKQMPK